MSSYVCHWSLSAAFFPCQSSNWNRPAGEFLWAFSSVLCCCTGILNTYCNDNGDKAVSHDMTWWCHADTLLYFIMPPPSFVYLNSIFQSSFYTSAFLRFFKLWWYHLWLQIAHWTCRRVQSRTVANWRHEFLLVSVFKVCPLEPQIKVHNHGTWDRLLYLCVM